MLRLLADENLDHDLVRGALRRRPRLDLIRVQDVGLSETEDPDILAWTAQEQRVVVTHDVNTMTAFAMERVTRGEPMAGVFIIHQEATVLSRIIEDLLLLDDCNETAEWAGQILTREAARDVRRAAIAVAQNVHWGIRVWYVLPLLEMTFVPRNRQSRQRVCAAIGSPAMTTMVQAESGSRHTHVRSAERRSIRPAGGAPRSQQDHGLQGICIDERQPMQPFRPPHRAQPCSK